jgi:peptidoglycan/LPS O-acetylase OafA/YrhL
LSKFTYRQNAPFADRYFAEIDGLRGVSVLLVLAFHLSLPFFGGGYLGVDAFFVISGYLITRILLSEINRGEFSYLGFLLRRAKRLLPALAVATVLTTIGAWLFFSRAQLSRFSDSLFGVGTYTSNFVFLFDGSGYFQQSAANTPLLHTWSLGVEEQFYILFPLFVLLFYRSRKIPQLLWALLVGIGASLSLWIWSREINTSSFIGDAAFFMLPTRAWELAAGGLLAIVAAMRMFSRIRPATNSALAFLGLALLPVALYLASQKPIQGFASILMVISTVLLIAHSPSTVIGRVLRARWLVSIGLISYGLYLFHYPLIAFAKVQQGSEDIQLGTLAFVVLGSFALASFSYWYIETPIRREVFSAKKSVGIVAIFASSLIFLGFASKVPATDMNPESEAAQVLLTNDWVYFSDLVEWEFQNERLRLGGFEQIETIVSGSSRTMQINSENSDTETLNLSVSSASLEDIYSLSLAGLTTSGAKEIYIGLDPWILNVNSGPVAREQSERDFVYWRNLVAQKIPLEESLNPVAPIPVRNYSWLTTIYNQLNFRDKNLVPQNGSPELIAKRTADGSHVYTRSYVEMSEQEISSGFKAILEFANMDNYLFSGQNLDIVRDLLRYLKENRIDVTLVLSPYHPDLYSKMRQSAPGFLESEIAFRALANVSGTTLVGSYDPDLVGCIERDFFDGMHPTEKCMGKVLEAKKVTS